VSLHAPPDEEPARPALDRLAGTRTSPGASQEDTGAPLTTHRDETVPEPLAAS
jgi:hypothetical protein